MNKDPSINIKKKSRINQTASWCSLINIYIFLQNKYIEHKATTTDFLNILIVHSSYAVVTLNVT